MTIEDRFKLERAENWREWVEKIPVINFPESWGVRMCPPYCGALVRFSVHMDEHSVSVYLDVNDTLGCVGQPYWEFYPNAEDDTERYLLDDVKGLLAGIDDALFAMMGGE